MINYSREEKLEHRITLTEALRSGKYKQGQGYLSYLFAGNRVYCCLGVGMEKIRERVPELVSFNVKEDGMCAYGGNTSWMPDQGLEYYGFSSQQMDHLIQLNDTFRVDFVNIANAIDTMEVF